MSAVLRKLVIRIWLQQLGTWLNKKYLEIIFILVGLLVLVAGVRDILFKLHIWKP